jgi:hypothetical protein
MTERLSHKKSQQQRRKRSKKSSKKHHHERESELPPMITNHLETSEEQSNNNHIDEDDEEERLLREALLQTLSNKRKIKIIEPTNSEPERIVTIIPSNSPPIMTQTNVNPPPIVVNKSMEISDDKSQYSINQRYKRVKANVSLTNVTNKTETTSVARTTQPLIQTRNKIVRAVSDFIFLYSLINFNAYLSLKLILIFLNPIPLSSTSMSPQPMKMSNNNQLNNLMDPHISSLMKNVKLLNAYNNFRKKLFAEQMLLN